MSDSRMRNKSSSNEPGLSNPESISKTADQNASTSQSDLKSSKSSDSFSNKRPLRRVLTRKKSSDSVALKSSQGSSDSLKSSRGSSGSLTRPLRSITVSPYLPTIVERKKVKTLDELVKVVEELIKFYNEKANQVSFQKNIKIAIQAILDGKNIENAIQTANESKNLTSKDQENIIKMYKTIKNLKIIKTFGNNNVNIVITLKDKGEPVNVVLQFYESKKSQNQNHGLSFMLKPHWEKKKDLITNDADSIFTKRNKIVKKEKEDTGKGKEKEKEEVDEEEDITQLRVKINEFFPRLSLNEVVQELHPNPDNPDDPTNAKPEELMKMIVTIGNQLSSFIDELVEKEVIWSDMKLGNILLREINISNSDKVFEIVVADEKTFVPYKKLKFKKEIDKENNLPLLVAKLDSCDAETSIEGRKILSMYTASDQDPEKAKEYFRDNWTYEYRYRMGTMLYALATGKIIFTDSTIIRLQDENGKFVRDENNKFITKTKYSSDPFDFSKSIFTTEEGKLLQKLIEELCDENPEKRINIKEAKRIIGKIEQEISLTNKGTCSTSTFQTPSTTTTNITTTTTTSTTRGQTITRATPSTLTSPTMTRTRTTTITISSTSASRSPTSTGSSTPISPTTSISSPPTSPSTAKSNSSITSTTTSSTTPISSPSPLTSQSTSKSRRTTPVTSPLTSPSTSKNREKEERKQPISTTSFLTKFSTTKSKSKGKEKEKEKEKEEGKETLTKEKRGPATSFGKK